jgi:hypothetical protein
MIAILLVAVMSIMGSSTEREVIKLTSSATYESMAACSDALQVHQKQFGNLSCEEN